jgi:phosphohistidine swiveling domain-containing protein
MPRVHAQLTSMVEMLEHHFGYMMDVEFTVENGKLFLLQCRTAKRTPVASATFAVDQVRDNVWSIPQALARFSQADILSMTGQGFVQEALQAARLDIRRFLFRGNSASPGAATGKLVFTSAKAIELAARGESVILMRADTSPDDLPGMLASKAIVTAVGGSTSHAAVVARGKGIPAVVGCSFSANAIGGYSCSGNRNVYEEQVVSVDGASGLVVIGELPMTEVVHSEEVATLLQWVARQKDNQGPRPIDISLRGHDVSLNSWLNDFYLSNLMAEQARGSALEGRAQTLKNNIEADLAAILTCYLAYAVASEAPYHKSFRGSDFPATGATDTLKSKYAQSQSHDTINVVTRLAAMSLADQVEYFDLCRRIFSEKKAWHDGFGGPKWAVIAQTACEYLSGSLPRSVYVDHVFDLRHNGDCMFNKHSMVASKTNESILVKQLHAKKAASGVWSLMQDLTKRHKDCNEQVQALYALGLEQDLWGASHERFQVFDLRRHYHRLAA